MPVRRHLETVSRFGVDRLCGQELRSTRRPRRAHIVSGTFRCAVAACSSSDCSPMGPHLGAACLALVFFTAALALFTYAWWTRVRAVSLCAWWLSVVFWFAGLVVMWLWRVTSG